MTDSVKSIDVPVNGLKIDYSNGDSGRPYVKLDDGGISSDDKAFLTTTKEVSLDKGDGVATHVLARLIDEDDELLLECTPVGEVKETLGGWAG